MDSIAHIPYILRTVLVLLGAGFMWAVWNAWQRRDRKGVCLVILIAGLALIAGGGIALTAVITSANAAEAAFDRGLSLSAAGLASVFVAAFFLWWGRRDKQQGQPPDVNAPGVWPPAPKPPYV